MLPRWAWVEHVARWGYVEEETHVTEVGLRGG